MERFWSRVEKSDGCWLWTGARNARGYGVVGVGSRTEGNRRTVLAHRLAYTLSGEVVAADQELRHTCDNPPCVRPSHMLPGTHAENMGDMVLRERHPRGEKRPNAKMSHAKAKVVRQQAAAGVSHDALARQFNVSRSLVSMIVAGKRWVLPC